MPIHQNQYSWHAHSDRRRLPARTSRRGPLLFVRSVNPFGPTFLSETKADRRFSSAVRFESPYFQQPIARAVEGTRYRTSRDAEEAGRRETGGKQFTSFVRGDVLWIE